jgi:photosystem II stability/assembly factor-like uncharacterized protein
VNLATFSYSSLSVVSSSVVFVAGDMLNPKDPSRHLGVIIHTTDGGSNWTETPVEQLASKSTILNSMHFVDPKLGWVVGGVGDADATPDGILLKTTDGGATWNVSKIGFKQVPTSVFFADAQTGWMGGAAPPPGEEDGEGGPTDILATTDGGQTWHAQRRVPVSITDLFFLDKNTGWATGYLGAVYHTTDGGRSWATQKSELEFNEYFSNPNAEDAKKFIVSGIHFSDPQHGLAAATADEEDIGRVVGTTNGGQQWSRRLIAQGEGLRDVFMLSPTEGWAVPKYAKYIYHTVDGGRFWQSEDISFEQEVPLFRVAAADASHVWAVGGGAIFFRVAR